MSKIFSRNINAKIYAEFSDLSSLDINKIRLDPPSVVKNKLKNNYANFIILKPLVESQNCSELVKIYENSKALWMFRDYKDVVNSNINKFGYDNGIKDILPIVSNAQNNWRSENISKETKELIDEYYCKGMDGYDAAALFWIARNRIYFETNLDKNKNIMLCKYEDLVTMPIKVIKEIYQFINLPYSIENIEKCTIGVHSKSIGKNRNIKLTSGVESICQELMSKLNHSYKIQKF